MTRRLRLVARLVLELSALLANAAALVASWRTPTPPKTTPTPTPSAVPPGHCPDCRVHWRNDMCWRTETLTRPSGNETERRHEQLRNQIAHELTRTCVVAAGPGETDWRVASRAEADGITAAVWSVVGPRIAELEQLVIDSLIDDEDDDDDDC